MPATVTIRTDYSASELRRLAAGSKDANQSRRLLSLAAVLDGMGRAEAATHWRHGPPDAARLGSSLQRPRPGRAQGSFAAKGRSRGFRRSNWPLWREIVETGPDRQEGRRGPLAADRPEARHRGTLRRRLSRAHRRQDFEADRLLAHQRPPASSRPERAETIAAFKKTSRRR